MFVDPRGRPVGDWEDDRFRRDAEGLSKFVLAGIGSLQRSRPPQIFDGVATAHCAIAAIAFAVGVLICKLPSRDRKVLREYLVLKLDQMLAEHGV